MEQETQFTEAPVVPLATEAEPLAGSEPAAVESDNLSHSTNIEEAFIAVKAAKDEELVAIAAEANALKTSFKELDKEVRKCGGVVVRTIKKMLPLLEQVRELLSRKGDERYARVRKEAGLPAWGKYLKNVAEEFDLSERTIQRKLAELRGDDADDEGSERDDENNDGDTISHNPQASYTPPTRREFRPYVELAGAVNGVLGEYDHPVDGERPTVEAVLEALRGRAIPEQSVDAAEQVSSRLEPIEQTMVPFIAAAIQYILSLENAVYYHAKDVTPERQTRLDLNKAAWREILSNTKMKAIYDAAREFSGATEQQYAAKLTVSSDGTPIEGGVQVPEAAPSSEVEATKPVNFADALPGQKWFVGRPASGKTGPKVTGYVTVLKVIPKPKRISTDAGLYFLDGRKATGPKDGTRIFSLASEAEIAERWRDVA